MDELIKKIPYYVIHRCIIPYTYELQPKELLLDIRSFVNDHNVLENTYLVMYNSRILFNDLNFYCNGKTRNLLSNIHDFTNISRKYLQILRRHINLRSKSDDALNNWVFGRLTMHRNGVLQKECSISDMYLNYSNFLWGLLTPLERTKFINQYLLNEC